MRKNILILTIHLLILCYSDIVAQGCSDAGFCTMGAMRPNQPNIKQTNIKLKSIEISHYTGATKFKDYINSITADFNWGIGKKYSVQIKLPYFYINGPLAKINDFSDVSLSATRNIISKEKYQINLSIGTKIPVNNASKVNDENRPLPMYYQTSLGTYDFITGISIITQQWLLATGFQMPLNGNNNEFLWGKWNSSNLKNTASTYPKAKNLRRGNDIMLRIERNFRFSRLNFHTALLGIYRLNEDIIDDPVLGNNHKVTGSDGLALTGLVGTGYKFSVNSGVKLLFGKQLIKREINPDGLSREWVFTIGYEQKF